MSQACVRWYVRKGAVVRRAGHLLFNGTTQPIIPSLIGTLFYSKYEVPVNSCQHYEFFRIIIITMNASGRDAMERACARVTS